MLATRSGMHEERGFSLIEVLIALSLLAGALTGLSQLFAVSTRASSDARRTAMASILAAQKLEQLRSVASELTPESVGSLGHNVDGLCDFLDDYGRRLGGGTNPPDGTVFVRRWAIESLPSDPTSTFLFRVAVAPRSWMDAPDVGSGDPRVFGGAELVTVHTRRVL